MVLAWGRGEDGQLGHGDADDRNGPEAIHTLMRKGVTGVHCGAEYTVAVCKDRQEVYSWGWYAQVPNRNRHLCRQARAGVVSNLALTTAGVTLVDWGMAAAVIPSFPNPSGV